MQVREKMTILITGAAGFIGSFLYEKLSTKGFNVLGLDNYNSYYDVDLKRYRSKNRSIYEADISNMDSMRKIFNEAKPDVVVNLAAQAGVRYSIENPHVYGESNLTGFLNVLEACRSYNVKHLVYASSSSVYGQNDKVPFSVDDRNDKPISLYAATKKANELMAYTYSHLYEIPTTGLRFFTVYGPAGRPDMAYFSFTKKILSGEPIQVFNHGDMYRDFTYVDDIVEGISRIVENGPVNRGDYVPYHLYNIGNGSPVRLLDFIEILEDALGLKGKKEFLPMQPGDVPRTWADTAALEEDYSYKPATTLQRGISEFVKWYKDYYRI